MFEEVGKSAYAVEKCFHFCHREDQDVTPQFVSKSCMIIRSSLIAFGLVAGVSIAANAETVKVAAEASTDPSFIIAQTNGQDRRDNRQDCRQQNGVVGSGRETPLQTRWTPELGSGTLVRNRLLEHGDWLTAPVMQIRFLFAASISLCRAACFSRGLRVRPRIGIVELATGETSRE